MRKTVLRTVSEGRGIRVDCGQYKLRICNIYLHGLQSPLFLVLVSEAIGPQLLQLLRNRPVNRGFNAGFQLAGAALYCL